MANNPPIVPFVQQLDLGDSGRDVIAVKRALSRAGYMQWGEFTQLWGEFAVTACKRFQRAKSLKQSGSYTFATHEALRKSHRKGSRTEWAYDALSISIMKQEDVSPEERVVARTVDATTYAIMRRDSIGYNMSRPMPDHDPLPNIPYAADCSGMATWCAESGGWVQDPNYEVNYAHKWNGFGNTATMWVNGHPVNGLQNAELCDLVFYGKPWLSGGAAHVVMLREFYAGVWYAISHGQASGPSNVRATYRKITGIRRYKLV